MAGPRRVVRSALRRVIDRSLRNPADRGRRIPVRFSVRLTPHVAHWYAVSAPGIGRGAALELLEEATGGLARGAAVVVLTQRLEARELPQLQHAVVRLGVVDGVAAAPLSYLHALLSLGGEPRATGLELIDTGRFDDRTGAERLTIAGWLLALGDTERASSLVEASGVDPEDPERVRLSRWLPEPPVIGGTGSFAVLDYRHSDPVFASTNLGDWVQTISMLGHLLRQTELELTSSDPALDAAVAELRSGIPESHRATDVRGSLDLVALDRDFSTREVVREGTWALIFGWYMWPLIGDSYAFPFPPGLRPIFVSFHVHDPRFLTAEAVAYLTANGPIGCRDQSTVRLLRERGVPAFFSGCLTTTVGTLFSDPGPVDPQLPTGFVDTLPTAVDSRSPVELVEQSSEGILFRGFGENLLAAREFLASLRARYRGIATSRLHSYLPSRSIGLPVDFRPADPNDPRFPGLIGLDDEEFAALRGRLVDRIAVVLQAIADDRPPAEVRQVWARLWAAELAG